MPFDIKWVPSNYDYYYKINTSFITYMSYYTNPNNAYEFFLRFILCDKIFFFRTIIKEAFIKINL